MAALSSSATTSEAQAAGGDQKSLPIVVVGGGLAGLSAAAEVVQRGGSVVIIDKMDRLGGNSAKASSGMNAAGSGPQQAAGVVDTPAALAEDTERSGKGRSGQALVSVLAERSAEAVRFLQSFGVNLDELSQLGGHSAPRTHRAGPDGKPMNIGFRIMSALITYLEAQQRQHADKVRILTGLRVTELLVRPTACGREPGRVEGVRYVRGEDSPQKAVTGANEGGDGVGEIRAAGVVLATGGYSANRGEGGLLARHAPCLRSLPTTNGAFATGDGVQLGEAAGAATVDLDQVQVHPTGLLDPANPSSQTLVLGPETLRGSGGVLLNHSGHRFVNELTTRDEVVAAMFRHCVSPNVSELPSEEPAAGSCAKPSTCNRELEGLPPHAPCPAPKVVAHLLLSEEALHKFGVGPAKFYLAKDLLRKYDGGLPEFCADRGLPLEAVVSTLSAYGPRRDRATEDGAPLAAGEVTAAAVGGGDLFGKTLFPCDFQEHAAAAKAAADAAASRASAPPQPPVYSAIVTPVLHYCMGGLRFDTRGRVLGSGKGSGAEPQPIPGLLAAGEVTGGLHGANRLAGNSLLECVVFGRIAAETALSDAATATQPGGCRTTAPEEDPGTGGGLHDKAEL